VIKTKQQLLRRLIILFFVKIVLGSIIFMLKNKFVGVTIVGASVITLFWIFIVYFKDSIDAKIYFSYFHMSIGVFILVVSGFVYFLALAEINAIIFKIIVGFVIFNVGFFGRFI
jgi:hypothetical protein